MVKKNADLSQYNLQMVLRIYCIGKIKRKKQQCEDFQKQAQSIHSGTSESGDIIHRKRIIMASELNFEVSGRMLEKAHPLHHTYQLSN